jgi:transcription factor CON7
MLSHPIATSSHLKFIQDYPSHLVSRQKISSDSSFYSDFVNSSPIGSPSATVDKERASSPNPSGISHYTSISFDFQPSPAEIYRNTQNQPFATNQYPNIRDSIHQSHNINNTPASASQRRSMNSYLSESPSPASVHASVSALPHSIPPQSQERFPHSDAGTYLEDRVSPGPERLSREQDFDKYPDNVNIHNHLLDHRRMSEPAVLSAPNLYAMPNQDSSSSNRYQHLNFAYNSPALHTPRSVALYLSPLQRGASTGSLRDLCDQHFDYPPQQSDWKHREQHESFDNQTDALDEPISPMNPNFSGGLGDSPTTEVPYSPISDNLYGPSPPGTGTSTSSSAPLSPSRSIPLHRTLNNSQGAGDSIDRKTYSFVALPGNAVKKRPRRRYDEIERLYQCSWPDCNKSYGTLNHLNAHVTMQNHGAKRSPNGLCSCSFLFQAIYLGS